MAEDENKGKLIKLSSRVVNREDVETISDDELELNTKLDGMSANLAVSQIFLQDLGVLIQRAGSDEEKGAWQEFERSFRISMDRFEELWELIP